MPCSGGTAYKEALTFCQPFKDRHWHWCRAKDPPSLLSNTPLHVLLSNFAQKMLVWLPSRSIQCTPKKVVWFSCLQVRQMLQRLVPSSPTFSGGNPVRCHVWHRGPAICTSRVVLYFFVFIGKGQNLGLASEHPTSLGVLATPAEQSVRRSVWGAFASKGWTRVNCSDVNDLTPKCRVVKSRAKIWKNIILLRDYELGEVVDIPQSHLPREMFLFLFIHV